MTQKNQILINPLQFSIRNPIRNEKKKKKIYFNFMKKLPLKVSGLEWTHKKKRVFASKFMKEIQSKINRKKKVYQHIEFAFKFI